MFILTHFLAMLPFALSPVVHSKYAVTYAPGGETVKQVIARTGAKEVVNGDYYGKTKSGKHFAFDLVLIKGKRHINYMGRRPVLVIGRNGKVRIEKPYKPQKGDFYAVAGSFYPTDPNAKRGRHVVILKSSKKLKFLKIVGTYRQIEKRLKGVRHIYMDGGSSFNPNVRLPTHIIRMANYQNSPSLDWLGNPQPILVDS